MIYVGIDPGLSGGIGVVGAEPIAYPYTSKNLITLLKKLRYDNQSVKVYVEEVHSMPQQGVKSMFTFGKGFGTILGILEALEFKYELVKPQTWKTHVGVTADKRTSVKRAQELFPDVSLLPTPRCRVPADGMAEALLIAYYGKEVSQSFYTPNNSKSRRVSKYENW